MSSRIVTKVLAGFGVAAALAALSTAAQAHVSWSIGINVPPVVVGAPVYMAPAPVYVAPPPVYVAPPPPVYYTPRPVYYAPPPVYYRPYAPHRIYTAPGYWRGGVYHRHR